MNPFTVAVDTLKGESNIYLGSIMSHYHRMARGKAENKIRPRSLAHGTRGKDCHSIQKQSCHHLLVRASMLSWPAKCHGLFKEAMTRLIEQRLKSPCMGATDEECKAQMRMNWGTSK